ncbi:unnamed protein product [Peronospora belbahrii]|uniref:Uncharacterized protein n=1 Tax=Peronospora belbahrii TaxID=622444 RepID=A0AAU9L2B8_9STRA|nr:unnamed protein product [Peronospora belbahrii]
MHGNSTGRDKLGQEILWSSRGQQVIMQWEKQYMELCVDALDIQLTDRVLEIGSGLAYSSSRIQTFKPQSHVIVECDLETLQRARMFAARHNRVEIMPGTWQKVLPELDQYDCVFFDDYPSRWHEFLDIVLKHCAAGARITGYLARELDLTRSGCQVMLSRVQVDVPEHCNYFPNETALVPVITVTDPVIAAGASDISLTSPVKLLLPQVSKRFQRAFNSTTSRLVQALHADTKFSRERQHIAEIREFLLAHDTATFLSEQSAECDDTEICSRMDDKVLDSREETSVGRQQVDEGPIHYDDKESRQNYLRTLRSKAALSKSVR